MSYYFDMYAALKKPIIDNSSFGIVCADENVGFNPPSDDSPWLQVFTIPNQPVPREIGAVLSDEISGIYQININYPADTGRGASLAKADEILAVYRRNASLAYGDAQVRIESAGISRQAENSPWYTTYLTIVWREFRCYEN